MKLDQLLKCVESAFDCKPGRPYRYALAEEELTTSQLRDYHTYTVFDLRLSVMTPNAHERLCECLWDELRRVRNAASVSAEPKPVLYWRYPDYRIEFRGSTDIAAIYTRICVPSVCFRDLYPVTETPYKYIGER